MASVVNGSRRLITRSTSTALSSSSTLVLLPARPRTASLPYGVASTASPTQTPATSNSFSTTAAARAKGAQVHIRSGKHKKAVSRKYVPVGRMKIMPGERKAYRKRIVLSNDNALPVPGLEILRVEHLTPSRQAKIVAERAKAGKPKEAAQAEAERVGSPQASQTTEAQPNAISKVDLSNRTGRMMALPDPIVDKLRKIEAFKPTMAFHLFRRPSVLLRNESVELAERLQREVAEQKKTVRLVVDGERIAGKSMVLLQAMTQGFMNEWLVISIPEAQILTTAVTEYAPVPKTRPLQFTQPNYTYAMLTNILAANAEMLTKYTTARDHNDLVNPVAAGSTLHDLVSSAKEPDHGWPVFQALLSELTDPYTKLPRPPVLFTLDGLAHIMQMSAYRSPSFELVHSHDLTLVGAYVRMLSGAIRFPQGAAIIAATSYGNTPANPTMKLAIAQRLAEKADQPVPEKDPYYRHYDDRSYKALQTVDVLQLQGVSKPEVRSLLEYWAASGILRETITEAAVVQARMLSGNGVIGELERAYILTVRPEGS